MFKFILNDDGLTMRIYMPPVKSVMDKHKKADALLMEHYHWQQGYREKLGYGTAAPECRGSVSSRQWDSIADITRETADQLDMESVDWCMDEIGSDYRQAIGNEMKNREAGAKVWSAGNRTYEQAVYAILPLMRKKNLI